MEGGGSKSHGRNQTHTLTESHGKQRLHHFETAQRQLATVLRNSVARRGDVALQHLVYLHVYLHLRAPDCFLFTRIKQYFKENRFSDSEIQ